MRSFALLWLTQITCTTAGFNCSQLFAKEPCNKTTRRTAVCVTGTARNFASPQIHGSLKSHVVDRLTKNVTVFAYLKLADRQGRITREGLAAEQDARQMHANRTRVLQAARNLGVRKVKLSEGTHSNVPNCNNYDRFVDRTCKNGRRPPVKSPAGTVNYRDSLIGQLDNKLQCYNMISDHENKTGSAFEFVVIVRPDLLWLRPITPLWCEKPEEQGKSGIIAAADLAFMLERRHAEAVNAL